jgi:DNA repair protein RecN (Recombination protein N)
MLGMEDAQFVVEISEAAAFTPLGRDSIAYLFTANRTTKPGNVERIASGGELSRIMLAIKTVIAKHDGLPTIVFDEVDTGVSGKTSRKIGYSLLASAKSAQIISITHSAQIASLAHRHLLVYKEERGGRTESSVRPLTGEERVGELARILGGIAVTEAQRQAARDMLSGKDL